MNLLNLLKGILNLEKEIDTKILPSQGLFYKDDFKLKIKKADIGDIIEYEYNYIKDNLGLIIHKIKIIVEKNLIIPNGYSFEDLKSIDIIFLFLEIVKITKGDIIEFKYIDELGKEDVVEFDSKNFNYFFINEKIMKYYNESEKCFEMEGYKYTLPSIGVESSLTLFLINKMNDVNAEKYNNYFYDFTYFVKDKTNLTFEEIENLIQIFNFDIEQSELKKISKILNIFLPIQRYSLIKNGKIIDMNSKIDLEKIWK
jgi:hypothetical protein